MRSARAELVDSVVPWLGPVPAIWKTRPLWAMFERIKDIDHPEEQMLSVFREHGVVAKDSRDNINKTAENRSIYQLIHPGWLVANRMKAWQGSVGISSLRGIVSGHYICFAPRHNEDHRYLNWLLRSTAYTNGYALLSRGVRIGQAEIDNDELRLMPILLPPREEQRAIADYLDHETAQIDTLIAKQEQLIATLRERRDGLVESSLVRGLDPTVDLRETAIPWLAGAVLPAHWATTRVKYVTSQMRAGEGITAESIEDAGPYRVFGGNGLRGFTESYTHSGTFVLIGRQGALCGNVHLVDGEFWASEHAIVASPRDYVDARWLARMLRLMDLGQYSMTTAQPGIGVGQIEPLALPLPPVEEQQQIAAYLDEQTAKIDLLIAKTERFIELAKERRTALITAAVTGQIDVRVPT